MGRSNLSPWASSEEWIYVAKCILLDDIELKRLAMKQMSVWEFRCKSLPIPVLSTKLFVTCMLADAENNRTQLELQMLYSIAIVRFINGYVDNSQRKEYAEPMSRLASSVNIPLCILECRHEITHQVMPSLSMLRETSNMAMKYLEDTYWVPLTRILMKYTSLPIGFKYLASYIFRILSKMTTLFSLMEIKNHIQILSEVISPDVSLSFNKLFKWVLKCEQFTPNKRRKFLKSKNILMIQHHNSFKLLQQMISDVKRSMKYVNTSFHYISQIFNDENIILSLLKDYVCLIYNPFDHVAMAYLVIIILSKYSPDLTQMLTFSFLHFLISSSENKKSNDSFDKTSFLSSWLKSVSLLNNSNILLPTNCPDYIMSETSKLYLNVLSWFHFLCIMDPCETESGVTSKVPTSVMMIDNIFVNQNPGLTSDTKKKYILKRSINLCHNYSDSRQFMYCVNLCNKRFIAFVQDSISKLCEYCIHTRLTPQHKIDMKGLESLVGLLNKKKIMGRFNFNERCLIKWMKDCIKLSYSDSLNDQSLKSIYGCRNNNVRTDNFDRMPDGSFWNSRTNAESNCMPDGSFWNSRTNADILNLFKSTIDIIENSNFTYTHKIHTLHQILDTINNLSCEVITENHSAWTNPGVIIKRVDFTKFNNQSLWLLNSNFIYILDVIKADSTIPKLYDIYNILTSHWTLTLEDILNNRPSIENLPRLNLFLKRDCLPEPTS